MTTESPALYLDRVGLAVSRIRAFNQDLLNSFDPSPPFAEFLARDDQHQVALRAANRVGKTRHAAFKLARRMVAQDGARCRVVGPSRKQTQEVIGRYLDEFLRPYLDPRSYYVTGKGWNTNTIRLNNGSICQLKSYEDRSDTHAGDSLDLIVMDEPPPRAHFAENQARVIDRDGQFILAFTAVNRPVDWLREIIEGDNGWSEYVVPFRRENVPWYSDAQYDRMVAAFRSSPWQWAQRVDAEWSGVTEGRIFSGFTEKNVTKRIPSYELSVGVGIDHGKVAGRQVGVLVAWKGSKVFVVDEYVSQWGTTPEQDAGAILSMIKRQRLRPREVNLAIGDTNVAGGGWRVNDLIEEAMRKQLNSRHAPFRIRGADKSAGSVDYGLRVVNHACYRGDLVVHERCTAIMDAMRHWQGGTTQGTDDAKLSHAADALRYICVGILGGQPAYSHLRFD